MEEICRLCCSTKFVNNDIFDEENALYLKMSLYLPIKVFKNDRLPQKVCDRCSCKVNDLYQFCNETIEVQNRLRAILISTAVEVEDSVDLTLIKENDLSPTPVVELEQKVNPKAELKVGDNSLLVSGLIQNINTIVPSKAVCEQGTQTDHKDGIDGVIEAAKDNVSKTFSDVKVKEEPKQVEVKTEDDTASDNMFYGNMASDTNSDEDMALIQFQKKKKAKKNKMANGQTEKRKRKKRNLDEWDMIIKAIPEGTAVTMVKDNMKMDVKQELQDFDVTETLVQDLGLQAKVKSEPEEYHCCMCFVQCYSRNEMLQHYKEHMSRAEYVAPPPAPAAPPATDVAKCPRCMKRLTSAEWSAHWARHWARDRRPLRCALCQKTFAEPTHILKHGASHKLGEENADDKQSLEKRFICDMCPEGFVYMRHLLSHRATNHPEAAAKALALRCALCQRQFAHLNSLRRHLHAHKGERNFLCSICGKALSSREHLKFHIRIHTGYKPNVCKTCGKGFVKKCNLTLHERVHTGERPHVCAHCGKAFSQRSTLVIHERYHSGARPYACTLCGRGFVAKGLLSMHLKTTCI